MMASHFRNRMHQPAAKKKPKNSGELTNLMVATTRFAWTHKYTYYV